MNNQQIADLFDNIADLLEIKGEIIHRVLSYRNAAETIRELPRDLQAVAAEGKLTDLPRIGKTLATKIEEVLETGELEFYDRLITEVPVTLLEIKRINGVGPKKARLFWEKLDITTVPQLEQAARAGKLRDLSGMGAKSEAKIIAGIEALARFQGRTPLGEARPAAQAILDQLLALPESVEGAIAGSIRRARPTIGDVDLLIAVNDMEDAAPIMQAFVEMPGIARVLGHGPTKSSIELSSGLQVDLRVLTKERWGTALNYFTGSQQHNIRMRELALAKGFSLNEHAFSPVDDNKNIIEDAEKTLCATEEDVYAMVGLAWVPPELREDAGEIEAARDGKLPDLITIDDIRGDLHMHTTASDGKRTIREMAEAAIARGRHYIVITDHSHGAVIANGLSAERLLSQQADVRAIDDELGDQIKIYHGVEMEINADGTLDYPDDVLAQLDFVIASLHVSLGQPRDQITNRMLNALNNPYVRLIGHPRGQLIQKRDPADLDMDVVLQTAKDTNTVLEINANPNRLDLEAVYARRALELGVRLAINTDAHDIDQMDLLPYGIMTARRGWVTATSVINTWPLDKFDAWLREGKS